MYESLKNKLDFDNVYKNGEVFGNRDFVLRFVKNSESTNRLGVVVSKKVSKKAVVRNRLRRQIKSCVRALDGSLKQGYDLIISAKPACADKSYEVLAKSISHLFYRKGLLIKK